MNKSTNLTLEITLRRATIRCKELNNNSLYPGSLRLPLPHRLLPSKNPL